MSALHDHRIITGVEREGAFAFIDVVDSVIKQRELGDQFLLVLNQDVTKFKELCEKYGGRTLKFTGDGWLMFFETSLDAAKWALEVRDYIYQRKLFSEPKFVLQHRIGIEYGKALVGETDAWGDPVNVAKRIESAALPNTIGLSVGVYESVKKELERYRDAANRSVLHGRTSVTASKNVVVEMARISQIADGAEPLSLAPIDEPSPEKPKRTDLIGKTADRMSPYIVFTLVAVAIGLVVIAFFEVIFGAPEGSPIQTSFETNGSRVPTIKGPAPASGQPAQPEATPVETQTPRIPSSESTDRGFVDYGGN
ncbi:MAG: hypothetical protein HONBIEJF_01532 [Fimbriimonadaceae bacterium]|nr:hypothetical protein [Fimbriimonadaceae bacterium]